jgi:predicted transposase/invertase (TIGR01784 family)
MAELVCKPKLDVVFKTLFAENTDLLRDFLTLVFETEIDIMEIMNPEMFPEQFDEKFAKLDLVIKTKNGDKINVELQNRNMGNYKERSVFNCSKLFTLGFMSGTDYSTIPNTVCINILQFSLFEGSDYRKTIFPTVQETGEVATKRWQIICFETPKLPNEIKNRLELWLQFFTISTEEALINMEATNDQPIKKAVDFVRKMNADDRAREIARTREDAWLTECLVRNEGRMEGRIEQAFDIARNMISLKLPIDIVIKSTGLSPTDIAAL